MKFSANDNCPCGSLVKYKKCCKPFHENIKTPITALELMKSRFSAFAVLIADYIIFTTHENNSDYISDLKSWNQDIMNFSKNTRFERLEILDFIEGEVESFVTFKATLFQDNTDISFIEKSRFLKVEDKWLYIDGQFIDEGKK